VPGPAVTSSALRFKQLKLQSGSLTCRSSSTARQVRCTPSCAVKNTRAVDARSSTFAKRTNTARQPSKFTVTPSSRPKSRNHTHSSAKHDGWTLFSKRRTLLRRLMGMGTELLRRCLLQMATAVLTHSARTAGRPSLHSSTHYHAQGRSHVIGVTLKVGHRWRSPTDTSTHSDLAHSLVFNYLSFSLCS